MKKLIYLLVLISLVSITDYSATAAERKRVKKKKFYTLDFQTGYNQLSTQIGDFIDPSYTVGAAVKYVKDDKLALVVGLHYNPFEKYEEGEGESRFMYENYDISLTVGGHYYFTNYKTSIAPYVGLEMGYLFLTQNYESEFSSSKSVAGCYSVSPQLGVSIPLNDSFHIALFGKFMFSWRNDEYHDEFLNTQTVSSLTDYNYFTGGLRLSVVL